MRTAPTACAGVEHITSVELTYTAGTESDPKTHSRSLLKEKPEPSTVTFVPPCVEPETGDADVTDGGVEKVNITSSDIVCAPSRDTPTSTGPETFTAGEVHSTAELLSTRALTA